MDNHIKILIKMSCIQEKVMQWKTWQDKLVLKLKGTEGLISSEPPQGVGKVIEPLPQTSVFQIPISL